jgi:hypothetical protein
MIRVSFYCCTDNEKNDIKKILKKYHDIEFFFMNTFTGEFDLLAVPVRELAGITNEQLENVYQPTICFGEISTIHIALAYSVDDFVIYPFIGSELSARIYKSIPLRFFYSKGSYLTISPNSVFCAGRRIPLRYQEFMLLKALISLSPEPVERSYLEQLHQGRGLPGGRGLDMLISKLRKKLAEITECDQEMIVAERGYGYRIIPCWKPLYKSKQFG